MQVRINKSLEPLFYTPAFAAMMYKKTSAAATKYQEIVAVRSGLLRASALPFLAMEYGQIVGVVRAHAIYAAAHEWGTGNLSPTRPHYRDKWQFGIHARGRHPFLQVLMMMETL